MFICSLKSSCVSGKKIYIFAECSSTTATGTKRCTGIGMMTFGRAAVMIGSSQFSLILYWLASSIITGKARQCDDYNGHYESK